MANEDVVIRGGKSDPDLTMEVLAGAVRGVTSLLSPCTLGQFASLIHGLEAVWTKGSKQARRSQQEPLFTWYQAWVRIASGQVDTARASRDFQQELHIRGTDKSVPVFKRWCSRVLVDVHTNLLPRPAPLTRQTASVLIEAAVCGGGWATTGSLLEVPVPVSERWTAWLRDNWREIGQAQLHREDTGGSWQQLWMDGTPPGPSWFTNHRLVAAIAEREIPGFAAWHEDTSANRLTTDAITGMPLRDPVAYQANVAKAFGGLGRKHAESLGQILSFPRFPRV